MVENTADIGEIAGRAAIQSLGTLVAQLRKAGHLDDAAADAVGRSLLNAIDMLGAGVDGAEGLRGWAALQLNQH